MSIEFNADEVFEIAEQIERNGAKFYRKASENFKDTESKQFLLDLASAEVEHENTFKKMRAQLAAAEKESTTFDPDEMAGEYLRAMAGGHVFDVTADPSSRLTGKERLEDILRQAIGMEKDSIVYYLGMKEITPEKLGRKHVDAIIKQEMGHVTLLSRKLARCKKR